jgi:hypothetical protein
MLVKDMILLSSQHRAWETKDEETSFRCFFVMIFPFATHIRFLLIFNLL